MKKMGKLLWAAVVLCACFLLWGCKRGADIYTNTSLSVVDVQPAGEVPAAVKYPSVYIQFSQPVVAVSALSEPYDTCEYMSITPPLKGVYRWYSTSLLCFEPSEPVIPQRKYTVTIPASVQAVDGTRISGMREYEFRTE